MYRYVFVFVFVFLYGAYVVRFPLPDGVFRTGWILDMSLLCENSINQSNQVPYVAVSYIHRDPAAVLSVISKGVVFFVFVIPPTAFYGGCIYIYYL